MRSLLRQAPREVPLGTLRFGTLCVDDEATSMSSRCRRTACKRICQSPKMIRIPGFPLTFGVELKALELEVLPPCKKRGTSIGRG
eukprot:2991211-Amphidinium_carterae.1